VKWDFPCRREHVQLPVYAWAHGQLLVNIRAAKPFRTSLCMSAMLATQELDVNLPTVPGNLPTLFGSICAWLARRCLLFGHTDYIFQLSTFISQKSISSKAVKYHSPSVYFVCIRHKRQFFAYFSLLLSPDA